MIIKVVIIVVSAATLLSVSVGLGTGSTAGNTVPGSVASLSYHAIQPSQVAPIECGGFTLERMFLSGKVMSGRRSNDLLIADYQANKVSGHDGSDCLIAASSFEGVLDGGRHSDVCIGGSQTVFKNCEVELVR